MHRFEWAMLHAIASIRACDVGFDLSTDERLALRRFANETGEDLDAAAHIGLRDFLISVGMLELTFELAEHTEAAGEAK